MPELKDSFLVGGTALSLKHGHRISVDIDLFQNDFLDTEKVSAALLNKFKKNYINENLKIKFAIFCTINTIKTDIVHYPHKLIGKPEVIDGIRMLSDMDIAAMKINAILGRGVKKDFFDLYELLKIYSLKDIIQWHKEKYPSQMLLISIPNAIIYFIDAEESPNPKTLNGETWENVKAFLQKKVREYLS